MHKGSKVTGISGSSNAVDVPAHIDPQSFKLRIELRAGGRQDYAYRRGWHSHSHRKLSSEPLSGCRCVHDATRHGLTALSNAK
jgi:hypothetical protein